MGGVLRGEPLDYGKRKSYIRNDVLYAGYRQAWQFGYDDLRRESGAETSGKAWINFEKPSPPEPRV